MGIVGEGSNVLSTYAMLEESDVTLQALSMVFILIVMLAMTYFVLMQYAVGQTLGRMVLNVYVVQQVDDKNLTRPRFWQCLVRNIFLIPTIPFVLLWIVDPVYFFFAKKGQRLTEWLSKTRVVEQFEI
jgi:uncharacterized RDD family membrane protein YckC